MPSKSCLLLIAVVAMGISAASDAQDGRVRGRSAASSGGAPLSVPLGSGAPFVRLLVEPKPHACGRTGCEVSIVGVTRAGSRRDITFEEVLSNGFPGTRDQMIGPADSSGMPAITYEQGNAEGENTFNVFRYDVAKARYAFTGTVERYGQSLPATTAPVVPSTTARVGIPGARTTRDGSPKFSYVGELSINGTAVVQALDLKITDGAILGVLGQKLLGVFVASAVTGEYANGTCTIRYRSDTMVGPCDADGFTGQRLKKSGKLLGTFRFERAPDVPASSAVGGRH